MNHIHYIRRFAAILAGMTCALLASAALAAPSFAMVPHPGPPGDTYPAPAPVRIQTIVAGGMPGWQITLIAVGAALLAATAAVLLDRARIAHQNTARATT